MVVDRRLDQDFVARLRQGLDDGRQGGDDACRMEHPFRPYLPAVAAAEPPRNRVVVGFRSRRIPENVVLHPPLQGGCDSGCRTEVHVGHPHGQHLGIGIHIPFDRVRPAARDYFIEIVFHAELYLLVYKYVGASPKVSFRVPVLHGRQAAGSSSRSGSIPLCSPMYPYLPCPIRTAMRCGETKNEAVVNCLVFRFLPPGIFPSVCWRCVGDSNP